MFPIFRWTQYSLINEQRFRNLKYLLKLWSDKGRSFLLQKNQIVSISWIQSNTEVKLSSTAMTFSENKRFSSISKRISWTIHNASFNTCTWRFFFYLLCNQRLKWWQNDFKINFLINFKNWRDPGVKNWTIFAPNVSKEALWTDLRYHSWFLQNIAIWKSESKMGFQFRLQTTLPQ